MNFAVTYDTKQVILNPIQDQKNQQIGSIRSLNMCSSLFTMHIPISIEPLSILTPFLNFN